MNVLASLHARAPLRTAVAYVSKQLGHFGEGEHEVPAGAVTLVSLELVLTGPARLAGVGMLQRRLTHGARRRESV
jgi:hypothetical protein